MSQPTPVSVVQGKNLGPQFHFDAGTGILTITVVSKDALQVLTTGSDLGALLTHAAVQAVQKTYRTKLEGTKINGYETVDGVTTLVDSSDIAAVDVSVNGASIDSNGILTLTESHGGAPVTVNLSAFLKGVVSMNGPNGVILSGSGTVADPFKAALVIDPSTNNVATVGANGLLVDRTVILAYVNANLQPTLTMDTTNDLLTVQVGPNKSSVNMVEVVGLDGTHLYWSVA